MTQPPGGVRLVPPAAPPPEALCVRDRARAALRECHMLVTQFFHAADALLGGPASADSTLRAEELMEKVLSRQVELLIEHQRLNSLIERLTEENRAEEKKLTTLSSA
eukprot:IDg2547t1